MHKEKEMQNDAQMIQNASGCIQKHKKCIHFVYTTSFLASNTPFTYVYKNLFCMYLFL